MIDIERKKVFSRIDLDDLSIKFLVYSVKLRENTKLSIFILHFSNESITSSSTVIPSIKSTVLPIELPGSQTTVVMLFH
jgi:hypothetical protein